MEYDFDVAVIGAGINGAGIARDAAQRGLSVVVLEKADFSGGTSGASSRLIHGGLRYLEYGEIPLVYESLHERRYLRDIAGHLVKPIRITIPIYETARRGPLLIRIGMLAYDLLSWGKRMPRHEMLSGSRIRAEAPGLNIQGLVAGARYYDAQVTFAERLVLENLLAASASGASVRNYARVVGLDITSGGVTSVRVQDALDGTESQLSARVVVNAGGPWVDAVLGTASRETRLIGGTKGSHIIVGRFQGAPDDAFYVEAQSDGRPFFIIPWNDQWLIGTTDIRYEGSLDDVRASGHEIEYLLAETNRVFPQAELDVDDIHYAYAGIRPLPSRDKGPESAITRKHIIRVNRDIARNLVSIIGGKLTTYRHLAEQTVDRVGRILGRQLPKCRTHETPLPGAEAIEDARAALAALDGVPQPALQRMSEIYGARATEIAGLAASESGLGETLGPRDDVLAAEVVFAIRHEMARTLTDIVYRRTMLGFDPDQGRPAYDAVAGVAQREFGWSDRQRTEQYDALMAWSDSLCPVRAA